MALDLFFTGEHSVSLDKQRRLSIPMRWRGDFSQHGGCALTMEPLEHKCLYLYPSTAYKNMLKGLHASGKQNDPWVRALIDSLTRVSTNESLDGQGRIKLPEKYCELARHRQRMPWPLAAIRKLNFGIRAPLRTNSSPQGSRQSMKIIRVFTMTFDSDGGAALTTALEGRHEPVMVTEVLEAMKLDASARSAGCYIDCTYGRGGHSGGIASRLGEDGRLLVIDPRSRCHCPCQGLFAGDDRVRVRRGDFAQLSKIFKEAGQGEEVKAVLFDLGVSSDQIENPERGFSFRRDGPLDMRMDPDSAISAADWLDRVEQNELTELLRLAGEVRHAAPSPGPSSSAAAASLFGEPSISPT